jgi:diacylglycerol O-acyltransferase
MGRLHGFGRVLCPCRPTGPPGERGVQESSGTGGTVMSGGSRPGPQARRLERLSPVDASNLRVESQGVPMHVAALGVIDGAPLLDAAGRLRLDAVRADVQRRLHLAPRLRQVLCHTHPGLGPPAWADDPHFDIGQHVRARPVPAPGDEAALLAVCSELNEPPLERSRPLWELWLLPGLADGNVGMFLRLHHVAADGVAALALMGAVFDAAPGTPPPAPPWRPAPAPSAWQMFTDSWRKRADAAVSGLRHPAGALQGLRSLTRQLRLLASEGRAPRVSFNQPAGTHRGLLLARADLARAKTVAHAHGATANDVALAAVAGGARQLLSARGEVSPGLALKASVAASNRRQADGTASGNRAGIMLVPLPVDEPDPVRRLTEIARLTRARKRYPPYQPAARFAQRGMVRAMSRQRLVNLFTSNLPGPPEPLYLAGARVLELFQAGVVQGNVTVAVGVLSYAGQLNFCILGDADTVPDLKVFADGLSDALAQLGTVIPAARS